MELGERIKKLQEGVSVDRALKALSYPPPGQPLPSVGQPPAANASASRLSVEDNNGKRASRPPTSPNAFSGGLSNDEERAEMMATLELMFLMAAVDGAISDEELVQLQSSLEAAAEVGAKTVSELGVQMQLFQTQLAAEGWSARAKQATANVQSDEGRYFAYRLCAAVAFADDTLEHAESAALDSLAQHLSLPAADARAVLRDVRSLLFVG